MLQIAPDSQTGRDPFTAQDDILRCAACDTAVTRRAWAIPVAGRHNHVFVNPAGLAFGIGCFSEVIAWAPAGAARLEATWFSGHTWQVSLCSGCGRHLGWRFAPVGAAAGGGFFGLIRDRLTS